MVGHEPLADALTRPQERHAFARRRIFAHPGPPSLHHCRALCMTAALQPARTHANQSCPYFDITDWLVAVRGNAHAHRGSVASKCEGRHGSGIMSQAAERQRAWTLAGSQAPCTGGGQMVMDIDATIVSSCSDKEQATPT